MGRVALRSVRKAAARDTTATQISSMHLGPASRSGNPEDSAPPKTAASRAVSGAARATYVSGAATKPRGAAAAPLTAMACACASQAAACCAIASSSSSTAGGTATLSAAGKPTPTAAAPASRSFSPPTASAAATKIAATGRASTSSQLCSRRCSTLWFRSLEERNAWYPRSCARSALVSTGLHTCLECCDRIGCSRTVSLHPPKLPRNCMQSLGTCWRHICHSRTEMGCNIAARGWRRERAHLPLGQLDVVFQLGLDRKARRLQNAVDVVHELQVVSMQRAQQCRQRRPRRRGGCVERRVAVEGPQKRDAPLELAQRGAAHEFLKRRGDAAQPNRSFFGLLRRLNAAHQAVQREPGGVCGVCSSARDRCQRMRPGVHLRRTPARGERRTHMQLRCQADMTGSALLPGLGTAQKQLHAGERCFQRPARRQQQNAAANVLQLHEQRMLWPLGKQRLQASLNSADGSLATDAQQESAHGTRRDAHAAHAASWRLGKFEVIR